MFCTNWISILNLNCYQMPGIWITPVKFFIRQTFDLFTFVTKSLSLRKTNSVGLIHKKIAHSPTTSKLGSQQADIFWKTMHYKHSKHWQPPNLAKIVNELTERHYDYSFLILCLSDTICCHSSRIDMYSDRILKVRTWWSIHFLP